MSLPPRRAALMAERLKVCLHGMPIGWVTRGSRRDRIKFEWADGYTPRAS